MSKATNFDAFNLLCGNKIGGGVHRIVFECRLRPELVAKVESETDWRYFANVHEMRFWSEHQGNPLIAKWLAPCLFLSPDGRILLQERARPVLASEVLPSELPAFLDDVKRENFGWIGEQLT